MLGRMIEVAFGLRMLSAGFLRKFARVIELRMLAVGQALMRTGQLGLTRGHNRLPGLSSGNAVSGKDAGLGHCGYARCAVIHGGEERLVRAGCVLVLNL